MTVRPCHKGPPLQSDATKGVRRVTWADLHGSLLCSGREEKGKAVCEGPPSYKEVLSSGIPPQTHSLPRVSSVRRDCFLDLRNRCYRCLASDH